MFVFHEYWFTDYLSLFIHECLVVCRLRRNGNFHLTESSKGSNDLIKISNTDNSHYLGAKIMRIFKGTGLMRVIIWSHSQRILQATTCFTQSNILDQSSKSDSDRQLILHESTHGSSWINLSKIQIEQYVQVARYVGE